MTAMSTRISTCLAEGLRAIDPAGGYLTQLGSSVHEGFYAYVLQDRDTVFPAVVLHPAVELPSSQRDYDAVIESSTVIVVAAKLGVGADAYVEVQSALADVRKALSMARPAIVALTKRNDFELGVAEPDLSRDSSLVMYAMTITVKFSEIYQNG